MTNEVPTGVTALFIHEGSVIAHASDFNRSRPGGFTLHEAQEHRARDRLMQAVVQAFASPVLWKTLSAYDCGNIVKKIGGTVQIIKIGEDVE